MKNYNVLYDFVSNLQKDKVVLSGFRVGKLPTDGNYENNCIQIKLNKFVEFGVFNYEKSTLLRIWGGGVMGRLELKKEELTTQKILDFLNKIDETFGNLYLEKLI